MPKPMQTLSKKKNIFVKSPQTTQFQIRMYLALIDRANLLDL